MTFQPELGGGRLIQLGCGQTPLPAPWESYDQEVDIAQLLPFPDECAAFIHAEHVIEHVPFVGGLRFLVECFRVLQPGGVVRIAFPDCDRFLPTLGFSGSESATLEPYLEFLERLQRPHKSVRDVLRYILCDNGHKSAWSMMIGLGALHAAGFENVDAADYGESNHLPLVAVDRHHLIVPREVVLLETTILEGTK